MTSKTRAAFAAYLLAGIATVTMQPARADTWDVPFVGDRIQVKAHPDSPLATFTVSDSEGNSIDVPATAGCDTLPCGFDRPEGTRFLTVESQDPIFVISRTREGRLLPAFRRSAEPPDCEARRDADEASIELARNALTSLYSVRHRITESVCLERPVYRDSGIDPGNAGHVAARKRYPGHRRQPRRCADLRCR